MRIFIKNIPEAGMNLVNNKQIHGFIFSIMQINAERIKEIITKIPFYIPVIGEINSTKKFEIEELIFFYKLSGIIIPKELQNTQFSCPKIIAANFKNYNVFYKINDFYEADYLDYEQAANKQGLIEGLILSYHDIEKWQHIISNNL